MSTIRTRFAPSPTGYMHIGNLRTALYCYLFAKNQKGKFILRIEDTDRTRYVEDAVSVIEKTLFDAKIIPDEGPHQGGDYGPYVQSERTAIYQKYANLLLEKGYAYRCYCDVEKEGENANSNSFQGYNRHCRNLAKETIEEYEKQKRPYVIRQKIPLTGATTFKDIVHGTITIEHAEIEDQVLIKRDGMPTYNFANVIDDHLMHITHIIRGVEFITSTPKYVLLYQALGFEVPHFIHLPPVMGKNPDGTVSKLSKRHGATGFSELIERGYLAQAITNYVALLGWSPKSNQEIFSMEELIDHFSLEHLSKSSAIFDYKKLDWYNGEYLKQMTDKEFLDHARTYLPNLDEEKLLLLASLLKTRIHRLGEIEENISFLFALQDYDISLFQNKRNKITLELVQKLLPELFTIVAKITNFTRTTIDEALHKFAEENKLKIGQVMWPLRIALAGRPVTPGGVTDLLILLGKEEAIKRMQKAIEKLA